MESALLQPHQGRLQLPRDIRVTWRCEAEEHRVGGSSAVHLVEVRGGVLGSGKENQCNNSLDKEVGDCLSTSC